MPTLDDSINENGKILLLGDSGMGKTGSKASLIAAGYKLLMVDTDNGFKILRDLLTNPNYPYAAYMKKHSINPAENISYIPIEVPIDLLTITKKGTSWNLLAPTSSSAWNRVINLLKEWKDGERNFGGMYDWGNDVVLDFDTLSTLAELAFFFIQDMNSRLGALEDDHGRDNGDAQKLLSRFLIKITDPRCQANVIVTSHIDYIDQSVPGAAQSPAALIHNQRSVNPALVKGFPKAIGKALAPQIGKRFNDMFVVSENRGQREISTVPTNYTGAKRSVWLEDSYPISTGLAEIFSALRYKTLDEDFVPALRFGTDPKPSTKTSTPDPTGGKKPPFNFGR